MIKNCPATPEARRAVLLQIVDKIYMKRTDNSYKHHYKLEFRILFKDWYNKNDPRETVNRGSLFGSFDLRAIFKGMYDVHKIYEKIEPGEGLNRNAITKARNRRKSESKSKRQTWTYIL